MVTNALGFASEFSPIPPPEAAHEHRIRCRRGSAGCAHGTDVRVQWSGAPVQEDIRTDMLFKFTDVPK